MIKLVHHLQVLPVTSVLLEMYPSRMNVYIRRTYVFDAYCLMFKFFTKLHNVVIIFTSTGESGNITVSRNGKERAVLTSDDHYSFNDQRLIRFSPNQF